MHIQSPTEETAFVFPPPVVKACICNAASHLNARQCRWIVVQNDTVISVTKCSSAGALQLGKLDFSPSSYLPPLHPCSLFDSRS